MSGPGRESALRIVLLFPELLGTYGDGGNAVVLVKRATWRGIPAEVTTVEAGAPVPDSADIYLLGGGEDGPQTEAARELGGGEGGPLHRATARGATVFAVCAGMQILGHRFPGAAGEEVGGLSLLDCTTVRTGEPRAVGELFVPTDAAFGTGMLTGFENHGGRTRLGSGARPLGVAGAGVGNGDGTEGVTTAAGGAKVLGTYLHGPVLARNPALADHLLAWALEVPRESLAPLPEADAEAEALRAVRRRALEAGDLEGVAERSWRDRVLRRN